MHNWQFAIICGLLLTIYRSNLDGFHGNVIGMLSGLVLGYGIYLWIEFRRSDKS